MAKFYTPAKLSENIRKTPEGYLLCLGVPIARTGWQTYGRNECPLDVSEETGTCEVYRSADEVFRPETIASFQGKSITIRHPSDFVGPDNWQSLTRGTAQNVRRGEKDEDGEESLLADLLITESMAIQLVNNGLREVSCGYEAQYEQTGEGKGRQFNIVGNHVALVEEGRAGSTYAINDHKGKVTMDPKKLIEKMKAKFGAKVVDEAMAEEKKEEAKDAPTVSNEAYDEMKKSYDEMKKSFDAWAEKMGKGEGKDEDKPIPEKKPEEKPAKDEDSEGDATLESRLTALETAVSKLLEAKAGDEDTDGGETDDEDEDDGEETMTGDTAHRVEILAPGFRAKKGDKEEQIRMKALDAAYATKDGKQVIDTLTGGKKYTKDNASMIFVGASEVLKNQRGSGLGGTKNPLGFKVEDGQVTSGAITAEKMNEINAAHWGRK